MKITVNNIDRNLRVELSQLCEIVGIDDNPKGVFLNWVTPDSGDLFAKQTKIIEKCVKKKIPMIVFDGDEEISPEEVGYLMGEGAFLWEPAVAGRNLFAYQPCWGRIYTDFNDIPAIDPKPRHMHLANCSPLVRKFPSFQKYYVPVYETSEFNVMYSDRDNNDTINQKVAKHGIPVVGRGYGTYDDIRATIVLGSERDYETGRLDPNFFSILEHGVIPLLPDEHRWYHAIFGDLVVSGEDDIEYILKMYDKIAFGCIFEVYQNLNTYLPEASVENVAKRIVNYFK
jgi:hypothetical protein